MSRRRKRKPWLERETDQMFAFGDLMLAILKMYSNYKSGKYSPFSGSKSVIISKNSNDATYSSISTRRRTVSKSVQREVWRRDEGRCIECGSNENLEFDHIIPFSKGGSNTARNIQLLCENCNRSKAAKI